jgi:formylglycine-generating enzyme required for sulfatase activity
MVLVSAQWEGENPTAPFYIDRFTAMDGTHQEHRLRHGRIKSREHLSLKWRSSFPAIFGSGEAAAEFASWAGGRLPSSSEWRHAALGTDGRRYPWGDTPPTADQMNLGRSRVNFHYENRRGPASFYNENTQRIEPAFMRPVDSADESESPFGLVEPVGNVREWVRERDGHLQAGASWLDVDPFFPVEGIEFGGPAIRAGLAGRLRPEYRPWIEDLDEPIDVGVRVLLPLAPE